MKYFKIDAFVPLLALATIEEELKKINVPGVTVSKVRGYGKNMNFFSYDELETDGRLEIFAPEADMEKICQCITEFSKSIDSGKGFIAVLPVENMSYLGSD